MKFRCVTYLSLIASLLPLSGTAFGADAQTRGYRLGPEDQISIRVLDLEKLQLDNALAPKIDVNGNLDLPLVGHFHAEGLTVDELEKQIAARLSNIMQNPSVSVNIVQYRSHPVSVLGAVRNPGVVQMTQPRRLLEVLSMAGGFATDSGDKIKISRRKIRGMLPLADTADEASSDSYVGQVDVRTLLRAADPSLNIEILENDVITVLRAEVVYVIGAVKKAGGFTLGERGQISVLQALSLAEGLGPAASAANARLLREDSPGKERREIIVNLKPIMSGSSPDVQLRANDILFIPTSGTKMAAMRGMEAAISMSTGAIMRY